MKNLEQQRFSLVAPFPPGSAIDSLARIFADGLARKYGQPAVVENLPGASIRDETAAWAAVIKARNIVAQ